MKSLIVLLCSLSCLTAFSQTDSLQKVVPGRKNSAEQQRKPYVIMISADGFRYDYTQKYKAEHLQALSNSGVKAESMIPSFPSVTFPNHYSIVTGLYPAHQGIVNNKFYNRASNSYYYYKNKTGTEGKWYGGTPLWVLAEQQHMLSASFYWVGSEADIKNTRPTYYYPYTEKINIHQRIQTVVNWLNLPPESRPHLITFYFPQVDHAGHTYGPDAPETEKQVHFVDSAVYELTKAVKSTGLDVNFIFVSDHGMTKVDNKAPLVTPAGIDTTKFIVTGDGILVELYAKDKQAIQPTYDLLKSQEKDFNVYLKSNMPAHMHYGDKDDWHNHIGDILLIPHWPKVFSLAARKIDIGWHGYDPYTVKEMHATFYAWGPAFKTQLTIPAFENVNIYPVVTSLLGLSYSEKIDGTKELAKKILK